jgi:hypothetical protein
MRRIGVISWNSIAFDISSTLHRAARADSIGDGEPRGKVCAVTMSRDA